MKKFLEHLIMLMCMGQVFAGPFPSPFQMNKTGLQAMEPELKIRAQNITNVNSCSPEADVEFLYRLNNFSKATQGLDSKLCEHLYSALIITETTPLQSIDISVRTLANVAKMLIDLQIIRDEIELSELTEEKEELQKSVVHFAKGSLAKPDDEDDLLTSFA